MLASNWFPLGFTRQPVAAAPDFPDNISTSATQLEYCVILLTTFQRQQYNWNLFSLKYYLISPMMCQCRQHNWNISYIVDNIATPATQLEYFQCEMLSDIL